MQTATGIILKCFPFQEYDQILHCFTEEAGLVKIFFKGARSKRRGIQGICAPLMQVEVVYRETRGELLSGSEIGLQHSYQAIRQNWDCLNAACSILHFLALTQQPGKPAPLLYALTKGCLEKIPSAPCPYTISLAFFIKLLLHEGLLSIPFICSSCHKPLLEEAFLSEGDWHCFEHKSIKYKYLQKKDLDVFYQLGECRTYSEMVKRVCSKESYALLKEISLLLVMH